mmetsp:Transcript_28681/g.67222  ORF Transcript_28681/g.67222 Transcript_28681/m.67222 type:complete len:212 (+) Transcript_28681:376-1011(+)
MRRRAARSLHSRMASRARWIGWARRRRSTRPRRAGMAPTWSSVPQWGAPTRPTCSMRSGGRRFRTARQQEATSCSGSGRRRYTWWSRACHIRSSTRGASSTRPGGAASLWLASTTTVPRASVPSRVRTLLRCSCRRCSCQATAGVRSTCAQSSRARAPSRRTLQGCSIRSVARTATTHSARLRVDEKSLYWDKHAYSRERETSEIALHTML